MELGKQIRKCRQDVGMTQEELAERIFVTRQTVSNWENDRSYPDIKSLLMLSSLFDVSLDLLVKGDLEEMKEKINEEDVRAFQRDSSIFAVLLIVSLLAAVPMFYFLKWVGIGCWAVLYAVTMVYAFRVEKQKKRFDIQSYREIVAFFEGKPLTGMDKVRESGKRMYQKILLTLGSVLIGGILAMLGLMLLEKIFG